jgi:CRP-like cAMP-binding protein
MLGRDAKIEMLKRVPLFSGCSRAELAQIASVADEVQLGAGRTLMKEGARGREFVVVIDGTVEVRRKGRRLREEANRQFFGEIALLTDAPRSATVTTSSDVRALVITDRAFRRLLDDQPRLQRRILATVALRLSDDL